MALEGVILDVDGTLVISNDIHANSWVEAFAAYDLEVPFETVRPLIGMGGDQLIPKVAPELNSEEGTGKAIAERRKELILNKYIPHITAANGTRDLILKMQKSGLHLVVASSATSEELGILLKIAQVDDLISEVTTSDDAEASKPAPDIVQAALKKAKMTPDKVVMLGDSPYDIESAGKAGVGVIALRCGGFSDEQLSQALAIYNDPEDLLQHYDSSILGAKG
ncbi:MAG: HAD family hydrolase [Nostoc sp.]|uniref:HAD family hydrolase n=1 Tax=Nostoc sp. TaxID=1180 RepID=UPI002FF4E898